jgi:HK97 family phage prohead protease
MAERRSNQVDPNVLQRRAAAAGENPGEIPCGEWHRQPFSAQMRAETVIWNGAEKVKLSGNASVVEKAYRMYDMFGEYDEIVDQAAFAKTLSRKPDVAYLVNHGGVTMARTSAGSLMLAADSQGLQTEAYVNPKRSDVNDLLLAIEDRDVTEMSFAFRIIDGQWNDDYSEFRILEIDLDRGDVSAVNYGANPYTSVAARQTEILNDLQRLPSGAQRAAVEMLQESRASLERPAVVVEQEAAPEVDTRAAVEVEAPVVPAGPQGRSLALITALLELKD